MKLKAKILEEHLTNILNGNKCIEVRSLESITLTDGKREHTFDIKAIEEQDKWLWAGVFPDYFDYDHPVIAIHLGEKLDTKGK